MWRNQAELRSGVFLCLLTTGIAAGTESLTRWHRPGEVETTTLEPGVGKGQFQAWGTGPDYRVFFAEFLPPRERNNNEK